MFYPTKVKNNSTVQVYKNCLLEHVRSFVLQVKLECNGESLAHMPFARRKIDAPEPTRTVIQTIGEMPGVIYVGFYANQPKDLYVCIDSAEDWGVTTNAIVDYLDNYTDLLQKEVDAGSIK